jgi:hypothetical protein
MVESQPVRPSSELGDKEILRWQAELYLTGTKGKMMCDITGSIKPPAYSSLVKQNLKVIQKYKRVDGGDKYYKQWVDAFIAGYGKQELSLPLKLLSAD